MTLNSFNKIESNQIIDQILGIIVEKNLIPESNKTKAYRDP